MKNKGQFTSIVPKLLSLAAAILLWAFVMSVVDPVVSRTFRNIPLSVEGREELAARNLVLSGEPDQTVNVELRGNISYMDLVEPEKISAVINVGGLEKGDHTVPITISSGNPNLRVKKQDPGLISVRIDEEEQETEKVVLRTEGKLPEGVLLGDVKITPETVTVTGPKKEMDRVAFAAVSVNLSDHTHSTVFTAQVKAYTKDKKEIPGITISPEMAEIDMTIDRSVAVPIKIDVRGEAPEGYREGDLTVSPNTVTIRGNSALIREIKEVKTKPVYWSKILDGSTATAELIEPEGTRIVNRREIYALKYERRDRISGTLTMEHPMITIEGLDEGLTAELVEVPDKITLTVQGDRGKVERLSEDTVVFYVNVKGLGVGEHDPALRTNTVEGISVQGVDPGRVHCVIKKQK